MIQDFSWRDLAPATVVAAFVGAIFMVLIRAQIAKDFARRADVAGLNSRLERLEMAVRQVPSHGDVRAVADRVAGVETQMAAASATITAMREDVRGVQHDLRLLLTHLMGQAGKPSP